MTGKGKLAWGTIVVLLVALAGTWGWKRSSDARAVERLAEAELLAAERLDRAVAERSVELLRLSMLTLSWALRPSLAERDLLRVNVALERLVKERDVLWVAVAGEDGLVVAASDKKLEGRPLAEALPPGTPLGGAGPIVRAEGDPIFALAPIQSEEVRLGTVALGYARRD